MIEKEDNIYRKLQQQLDTLPIGFPATKSGVEIRLLKFFFTPEEAEIAINMRFIPEPVKKIYRRVKKKVKSIEELELILDRMYHKGAINLKRLMDENGEEIRYHLAFLAVGMYEYQVKSITKEFYEDIEQYFEEEYRNEIVSTKINQLRTIPVEESITPEHNIATYDELRTIIERTEKISIMDCICQKGKDLIGESCKQTNIREHCFALNNSAQHVVDINNGRFITKDEALNILKKAQEEGLILQPGNAQDPNFICCCCGCCCDLITNLKKLERPWEMFYSNYYANVDSDSCIGCETCLNRCQMDAISMVESIAVVEQNLCIGCGNCVTTCPEQAITLKRKDKEMLPPKTTTDLYLKMMVKKAELRRAEKGIS